jgi:thiamine kinase-like enzyme
MVLRQIYSFVLLLAALQAVAFSQGDEETIRHVFEKTIGRTNLSLQVSRINGGLTNKNFKVVFEGDPLFVRLGHSDPKSLRIDRVKERALYTLVEKDGIAPKLIYSDAEAGTLIASFIQGSPYGKMGGRWLYDRDESIKNIVAVLQQVHAHESSSLQSIDYPFHIIEEYICQAHSASIFVPPDIERAVDVARKLKAYVPQHKNVLCHQDLVPDNFIYDGKKLYLVDWEYADFGNAFYDLAALCIEHGYNDEEKELLLKAYFQTPTEEQRIHLEIMCMLYSLRDSLWYIIQNQQTMKKPCDFLELANYHYQNFAVSERWLQAHHISLGDIGS